MGRWCACVVAVLALSGCGGYQLRGLVVEGEQSGIFVVDENDARLKPSGLVGVTVRGVLDPSSLGSKPLGTTQTDDKGWFTLPVQAVGAGWGEYEVSLLARRSGFAPTRSMLRLPPSRKRLIVVMTPGQDRVPPEEDLIDETNRWKKFMEQP